jgi:glyoxylase-like metal-dependent hydrolase (beta-lactamase superfamily II)
VLTRRELFGATAGVAASCLPLAGAAQQGSPALAVTNLRGLQLITGAGANVVALPGADGALMIDGGLALHAESLLAAFSEATGSDRVHTLINTHWHPEQTGANVAVGRAGGRIFAHEKTALYLGQTVYLSAVVETPLAPLPDIGRPNQTTRGEGSIDFDGKSIPHGYVPQAHTDGDLFVRFPDHNVLVAGGVVAGDRWPLLDHLNGAWYGGRVRALQRLADEVDADTIVVGASGPTLTGRDIVRLRDVYLELFDTLIDYMNRGYGPEDAEAEAPLARFNDEFGDAGEFVYGAYRSMLVAYVPE